MDKKKVQVTIHNVSYSFVTDESEEHLQEAACYVDESIQSILQAGVSESSKASVLTALQCASKFLKAEKNQQQLDNEQKRLIDKIEKESELLNTLY